MGMASDGARADRGGGNAGADRKTLPGQRAADRPQQVGLAAEQMGAAGDVEKQPMRRIERHQRGKTVAPVGDVVQCFGIGGRIGVEHCYVGTDRPRIGQRLADLEPDGGLYHAHLPSFDGHDGFRRDQVTGWIQDAGLRLDQLDTAYVDRKPVDGVPHDLAIFVAVATRP